MRGLGPAVDILDRHLLAASSALHDLIQLMLRRTPANGVVNEGHNRGIALVGLDRVHLRVATGPELRLNLHSHLPCLSRFRRKVRAQSAIWPNGQDAPAAVDAITGYGNLTWPGHFVRKSEKRLWAAFILLF